MFEKNYKDQINSIKPDKYIKDKVRRRLAEGEYSRPKKRGSVIFGQAVATVLCCALLFSAGVVAGRKTAPVKTVTAKGTAMVSAVGYDKIYETVKTFMPTVWDKLNDKYKKGSVDELYEVEATEDGADLNTGINGNATNGSGAPPTAAKPGSSAETSSNSDSYSDDHSDTTVQVAGVDEADIVKTDGRYIFVLKGNTVKIVDTKGEKPVVISEIKTEKYFYLDGDYAVKDDMDYNGSCDMYLSENRLIITGATNNCTTTCSVIYDITDKKKPKFLEICRQSGYYTSSRLTDGILYVISNYQLDINSIRKSNAKTYVPSIECKDFNGTAKPDTLNIYNDCARPEYTVVTAYDIKDGSLRGTQSVLGGSYTVYASRENIITAGVNGNKTQIARFALNGGKIEVKASAQIDGNLLNQFSIDEYKGHFRFVLTDYNFKPIEGAKNGETADIAISRGDTTNSLIILDGDLKETGKITDIAKGEQVYSVRFMGDTAYFVTFRQVDPLFSVDISNPTAPKIIGSLKIPGFSNYLFPYGNKLLGIGKDADEKTGRAGKMKLSMFDISDPANVTESDKLTLDVDYSEALYNHKAVLVDYRKNIIAFHAFSYAGKSAYTIYSHEKDGFKLKAEIGFPAFLYSDVRGLYIGNVFYIVTPNEIKYLDLTTYKLLGELKLY